MTLALRKLIFDNLSEPDRQGVREVDPTLLLGEPVVYTDSGGAQWLCYTDSRWMQLQIAMLAAMSENLQDLKGYDSPYVDNDTQEITDREAYHQEMKTLLQDDSAVTTPMTLPADVTPSDTEAERPSFEDIRAAQEGSDGSLDSKLRLPSLDSWTRVEE